MKTFVLVVLVLSAIAAITGASPSQEYADYFPLKAAPDQHKPLLENEFVLVLDVSIPAGATVPAHLHPWPAVFITLKPAHLVFRNLAARAGFRTRQRHQCGYHRAARTSNRAEVPRPLNATERA